MPEQTAPWVEPVRQRLRAWRAGQLLLDTCQYKGEANYLRVRDGDVRLWTYRHPDPEAAAIAGHLAAAAEHPGVHITIDGTPQTQP